MSASTTTCRRCRWRTTSFWLAPAARSSATSCWCAASSRTCGGGRSPRRCSVLPRARRQTFVMLGALFAESRTPGRCHHRDLVGRARARRLHLEPSRYTGPTGIVGVLKRLAAAGIPRCPTGRRPALRRSGAQPQGNPGVARPLEDLLGVAVDLGDLPEEAKAWERGVDEMASGDTDVADYVRSLEEARDTADLPEATGEAIAREFERYLRRRTTRPDHPTGVAPLMLTWH